MSSKALKPSAQTLYDEDFAAWAGETARLLRAGRLAELDSASFRRIRSWTVRSCRNSGRDRARSELSEGRPRRKAKRTRGVVLFPAAAEMVQAKSRIC